MSDKKTIIPVNLKLAAGAFLLVAATPLHAGDTASDSPTTWNASIQAGFANTFQLVLGGYFGKGWDVQNRATVGLQNAFRRGDSLSAFGWSSTDIDSATPNWQAGASYKAPVFTRPRHSLILGGGVQRWVLPMIKTGAKDWLAMGYLTYSTRVRNIPLVVTGDSYSLLSSTLPKGSGLYTQVYTQHRLWHRPGFNLFLRQGPIHAYSWYLYGLSGNRVFRYSGTVALAWKNTTLEVGCRQQVGLQDGIPHNRFWTILLTRQISGLISRNH